MVFLAYATCCVLWGSTWLFVKLGLRDLPPFLFAGTRMLLAGAMLTPILIARETRRSAACFPRLPRRTWATIVGIGILQIAIPYALMFSAQRLIPSGWAAVFFASFPIWAVILGRIVLGEAMTRFRLLATVIGMSGIVLLQLPHLSGVALSSDFGTGGLLTVTAAIVCAVANVLTKSKLGKLPPMAITWGQTMSSSVLLLTLALAFESGERAVWSDLAIGSLVYLALFGTVITYVALYWLIPRVPLAVIGAIPLVDTTIAVSLGAIVLKEPVDAHLFAGGVLVLGGVALANVRS